MGLFNLFQKTGKSYNSNNDQNHFEEILDAIISEVLKEKDHYSLPPIQNLTSFKKVKDKDIAYLKGFLNFTLEKAHAYKKAFIKKGAQYTDRTGKWPASMKLAAQIFKLISPLSDEEFYHIVQKMKEAQDINYDHLVQLPFTLLFEKATAIINEKGMSTHLIQALQMLAYTEHEYMYSERRKINEKINFLLQGRPAAGYNRHDKFGKLLDEFTEGLNTEKRNNWFVLFNSCIAAAAKPSPSQKWITEVKKILANIDVNEFSQTLQSWLQFNKELIRSIHKNTSFDYDYLRDENHNLLKGMIWCAGIVNNTDLNAAMDDYAAWAFKKKPGVGPISAKTGTACMYAFEMLPFKDGISKLVKFKMKIKNNTILKSIDKIIKQAADKNGISEDLIMEIGVPDFGLTQNAELIVPFEDYKAVYTIKGITESELLWSKNGKLQKAAPQNIKTSYINELKVLKNTIKEIEELLPVQRERIERCYVNKSKWRFEEWMQNYIAHPLVSIIAKKLVWHFSNSDGIKGEGIFYNGGFVNAKKQVLDWIINDTEVQLWHPIGFSAEEILQWRNFMQDEQIRQPFKQAYREVYIITDAEINTSTYSNRFAAHILKQHQFAALCRLRGWSYNLMGNWDSHNTPSVDLTKWNINAQYYVDSDWESVTNESGIFTYISTDQVRFYKNGFQLQLTDVPAMVFTEVMRDVDLFVGVTSIGNDSNWQDTGNMQMNAYWQNYSFGELTESSKVRSEVLKNLIPRLKIAHQCSFDGKYLIVKGSLRTYKIHMGSGNILMEPNDQYLCIVPGRQDKSEKIFLPFEGDNMLSIILSKAFLLAEDNKITDNTITRQIEY